RQWRSANAAARRGPHWRHGLVDAGCFGRSLTRTAFGRQFVPHGVCLGDIQSLVARTAGPAAIEQAASGKIAPRGARQLRIPERGSFSRIDPARTRRTGRRLEDLSAQTVVT